MTRPIPLSSQWAAFFREAPETGMGYHVVSVFLKDGRKFDQVVIDSGYISRVRGYREIPFQESEISEIKVTHDKWDWQQE